MESKPIKLMISYTAILPYLSILCADTKGALL